MPQHTTAHHTTSQAASLRDKCLPCHPIRFFHVQAKSLLAPGRLHSAQKKNERSSTNFLRHFRSSTTAVKDRAAGKSHASLFKSPLQPSSKILRAVLVTARENGRQNDISEWLKLGTVAGCGRGVGSRRREEAGNLQASALRCSSNHEGTF